MALPEPFYFKGGQPAVILLHTFSGTPTDVRVLGRSLQKQGYTVMGPMFTGHGTADPKQIFMQGRPEQWWQDTIAAIHQLEVDGHHQIAIFGESLGGLFAMKHWPSLMRLWRAARLIHHCFQWIRVALLTAFCRNVWLGIRS
ncbi:alpha/beta hydrolase [Secundilactobacillus odoratitofui]|uniref:alpha/beta hydrolase n=1 Tax=Secundilactobacillus odoratitofui TaxID=480930 RepID=UPI0006D1F9B9|nr:alpha/beta hydrolase [Secundilactobacillus odoratitofui]